MEQRFYALCSVACNQVQSLMKTMQTVTVNGVDIFPFNSEKQLLEYIDTHKGILVAINAEKIMHATPTTRNIINNNVGYCDGVGAVWALRQKGHKQVVKIPGCELWLKIIERFHSTHKFYLIGGKQEVIDQTVSKLKSDFPGLDIAGCHNGYMDDQERTRVVQDVVDKKPDVVFVAMGSPKQELFMSEMQKAHPQAIYQGLGGSFDVYTGNVERAPQWWIDHNLEFAHRFITHPKRWKRLLPIFKMAILLLFRKI